MGLIVGDVVRVRAAPPTAGYAGCYGVIRRIFLDEAIEAQFVELVLPAPALPTPHTHVAWFPIALVAFIGHPPPEAATGEEATHA